MVVWHAKMKQFRQTTAIIIQLFLLICGVTSLTVGIISCKATAADLTPQREQMVKLITLMGVSDQQVLSAMRSVPRHLFVPSQYMDIAYDDSPLPIGSEQTISEPFIVAFMTEALKLKPSDRVLEVGTGSGYQAAVLSKIVQKVYTIEIIPELEVAAAKRLKELGYENVTVRKGDGYQGWCEEAPFDAIIITAAAGEVPKPLLAQLKSGGRLVIPLGKGDQWILRVTRREDGFKQEKLLPVRFVPMTGKSQQQEK
jgi:protein-L-isoaspartate(D-aspartate) O-methyltransferase